MNLLAFEAYMTSILNVGDAITAADLRVEVKDAGRWMESNYTFLYMEAFRTFIQAIGDRYIALSARPKAIDLLREVMANGEYRNFDHIDARDMDVSDFAGIATPSAFWIDGQGASAAPQVSRLVLNLIPTAALSMEMIETRLTDWEGLVDASNHWLFDNGRTALSSQVMWQLYTTPRLRDMEMAQLMATVRQQAIDTLLNVDDELRRSLRSVEMRFGRNA